MRIIFSIVVIIMFASCSNHLTGLYQSSSCGTTLDCSKYEFCADGRFKYQFQGEMFGEVQISGAWRKRNDTLYLNPDKPFREKKSHLKTYELPDSTNTKISVMLLSAGKDDHGDTIRTRWEISLNDENKLLKTSETGELLIDRKNIDSLWLVPTSATTCFDNQWIKFNPGHNRIEIYIADCQFQPVPYGFVAPKFYVRNKKIFVIWPGMENRAIEKNSYYKRIKRSCDNILLN